MPLRVAKCRLECKIADAVTQVCGFAADNGVVEVGFVATVGCYTLARMTSTTNPCLPAAGLAAGSRRYGVLAALLLATCAAFAAGPASHASEIVIGRRAVQSIVTAALFTDQGRWYLTKGNCFAYLDTPRMSLAAGRLVLDAHLVSRVGLDVGGACMGTGLASEVKVSGKFVGAGSHVTLQDIRIDHVKDDDTRQALELLQTAAGTSLPSAVNLDLLDLLQPAVDPGTGIKVTVTALEITGVMTQSETVTVSFETKLRADQ